MQAEYERTTPKPNQPTYGHPILILLLVCEYLFFKKKTNQISSSRSYFDLDPKVELSFFVCLFQNKKAPLQNSHSLVKQQFPGSPSGCQCSFRYSCAVASQACIETSRRRAEKCQEIKS